MEKQTFFLAEKVFFYRTNYICFFLSREVEGLAR